ncbi:MAG TPA: hypothetical protein VFX76_22180, partial [Roseiflexaceae bacterium]|nr:hypothetical protein [Roseiflexaceae bacterium]
MCVAGKWPRAGGVLVVCLIVFLAFLQDPNISARQRGAEARPSYVAWVRSIETADFGLPGAVGLAFVPRTNAVLALSSAGTAQNRDTSFVAISVVEDLVGSGTVAFNSEPLNGAFDPVSNRLMLLDPQAGELDAVSTNLADASHVVGA